MSDIKVTSESKSWLQTANQFAESHKALSIVTLGFAIVIYATFSMLMNCFRSTPKIQDIAEERFSKKPETPSLKDNQLKSVIQIRECTNSQENPETIPQVVTAEKVDEMDKLIVSTKSNITSPALDTEIVLDVVEEFFLTHDMLPETTATPEEVDRLYKQLSDAQKSEDSFSTKLSERTRSCKKLLNVKLAELNKKYGYAKDDGDCFFDAFAQALNRALGSDLTDKDLRKLLSEHANNPENQLELMFFLGKDFSAIQTVRFKNPQSPTETEMEKSFKAQKNNKLAFEEYKQKVGKSIEDGIPMWGREYIEGEFLCEIFGVNLRVYGVSQEEPKDPLVHYVEDFPKQPTDVFKRLKDKPTIEIALYPGHFIPVFNNA